MMKRIIWVIIPVVFISIWYSFQGGQPEDDYVAEVRKVIDQRIAFLEENDQSPFKLYGKSFEEPAYFPIDPMYKVRAKIERLSNRSVVDIQTSDGKIIKYLKYAWARFKIGDQEQQLLILKNSGFGPDKYFLAFADQTSGLTTYGGGRYLDIELDNEVFIDLDFNFAYNPYCAYVSGYSCPLPPVENILNIAINAGEKDFKPAP